MPHKILLGITGSIAGYKVLQLIRWLKKADNEVRVVMTQHATKVVAPLSCQVLSKNKVLVEMFDPEETGIHHISLSEWADIMVVAPATANIIGKAACGIGDDLLSTLLLSFKKPILFVPAMDENMWQNSIVQENVDRLIKKGYHFLLPSLGELASGRIGQGRFPSLNQIYYKILSLLEGRKSIGSKRVLLTAGRTYENLDPFRIITNLSSGRMGTMIAYATVSREGKIKAIFGEVTTPLPEDLEIIRAFNSGTMEKEVIKALPECDILIMAAAVADFRPKQQAENKIKDNEINVGLQKTTDILKAAAEKKGASQIFIGFSLETEDPIKRGFEKLQEKKLDILVVNDRATIGSDLSQATLLFKNQQVKELGRISKWELANRILDECIDT